MPKKKLRDMTIDELLKSKNDICDITTIEIAHMFGSYEKITISFDGWVLDKEIEPVGNSDKLEKE